MKRARLNLVIDAVVGGAFLVTAVTGVVFLLPPSWQQALLVGFSFHAWHRLHDWSGVVAAGGVALHLALHWRWVVHTARRWLAETRGEAPDRRAGTTGPSAAPGAAAVRRSPHERHGSQPGRTPEPRTGPGAALTRRGFIVGAAGFGAALVGGAALSKLAGAIETGQTTAGDASTGQSNAAGSSSSNAAGSSSSGAAGSSSSGTSSGRSGSGGSAATTTARVVVDSSSCIGCGHCLQVCPRSVFAWDSAGRATTQSPESCILCRRCVQVCPAAAITLNA